MKEKIALAAGLCEDWEICPQCKPRMEAILALIEQEQKPKDIALGLAKDLLESHGYDAKNSSVIREIDAVLGGSHE